MAVSDLVAGDVWTSGAEARRRSGLSRTILASMCIAGRIRTMSLPGLAIRYHGADCDKLRLELAKEPAAVSA